MTSRVSLYAAQRYIALYLLMLCFLSEPYLSFSQNQYNLYNIYPSDGDYSDLFGASVSIDDSIAIIGSVADDDLGNYSGSAYLFKLDPENHVWEQLVKLNASDGENRDEFGQSVSISKLYAVVGAPGEEENGNNTGAVYIFYKNQHGNNKWGQIQKIKAPDKNDFSDFGCSVSISDEFLFIGSRLDDEIGLDVGSVYVFQKELDTLWKFIKKIVPSDAVHHRHFGTSVSISGDYLVVGAPSDDGIDNNPGAAYVFYKDQEGENNWGEVAKLDPSNGTAGDCFGFSVGISRSLVAIGSLEDNSGDVSGYAYVFHKDQGGENNWGEIKRLRPSCPLSNDFFGYSVSVSKNKVLVGAFGRDDNHGIAYLFEEQNGKWNENIIQNTDSQITGIEFGRNVYIGDKHFIIGSPIDYSNNLMTGCAYISTNISSGIAQTKPYEISLYPNPVTDVLQVESGDFMGGELIISDLSGNIVYRKSNIRNKENINLKTICKGIYFIRLMTSLYTYHKVLIKL